MPEPLITIAAYDVSCLPVEHPERHHYTIRVQFKYRDGQSGYAVEEDGYWLDRDGQADGPMVLMTAEEALAVAQRVAPQMVVNGHTVAEVLAKWEARHA